MPRIISEQKNRWGAARTQGGLDPQRNDLWVVDFTAVVNSLNGGGPTATGGYLTDFGEQINPVPTYFAKAVVLPELRIKPETVRRNSRPYHMPSWDDPLDAVKISFMLENRTDMTSSHIYRMLDTWRLYTRAGRGALGTEREVTLNSDYRINYRFPIYLTLLRGAIVPGNGVTASTPSPAPPQTSTVFNTTAAAGNPTAQQGESSLFLRRVAARLAAERAQSPQNTSQELLSMDLQISGFYVLQKCWLGGFRVDNLAYAQPGLVGIEATIYAENLLDNQAI